MAPTTRSGKRKTSPGEHAELTELPRKTRATSTVDESKTPRAPRSTRSSKRKTKIHSDSDDSEQQEEVEAKTPRRSTRSTRSSKDSDDVATSTRSTRRKGQGQSSEEEEAQEIPSNSAEETNKTSVRSVEPTSKQNEDVSSEPEDSAEQSVKTPRRPTRSAVKKANPSPLAKDEDGVSEPKEAKTPRRSTRKSAPKPLNEDDDTVESEAKTPRKSVRKSARKPAQEEEEETEKEDSQPLAPNASNTKIRISVKKSRKSLSSKQAVTPASKIKFAEQPRELTPPAPKAASPEPIRPDFNASPIFVVKKNTEPAQDLELPEPTPEYPSLFSVLLNASIDVFYKSAFLGVVLTHYTLPYFQKAISFLIDEKGRTEQEVFAIMITAVHAVAYILFNGFFGLLDTTGLLSKYKIGRKSFMVADSSLILRTLTEAAFNLIIVTPVASYVLYYAFEFFGMASMKADLPSCTLLFFVFARADLVNQFGFYFFHRFFHSPQLYSRFHKQHHTYRGTIGIAAEYAGTLETIFANQLPTIAGVLIAGTHPLATLVWLFLRLRQTYEVHSGYFFKNTIFSYLGLVYPNETAFHDYHHTVNRGNFGYELTDYVFGTMDGYVQMGMADGYVERMKQDAEAGK